MVLSVHHIEVVLLSVAAGRRVLCRVQEFLLGDLHLLLMDALRFFRSLTTFAFALRRRYLKLQMRSPMAHAHYILRAKLDCHLRLTILCSRSLLLALRAVTLSTHTCRHIMRYMSYVELNGRARLLQDHLRMLTTVSALRMVMSRYQALGRSRVPLNSALIPRHCSTTWLVAVLALPLNASIVLR